MLLFMARIGLSLDFVVASRAAEGTEGAIDEAPYTLYPTSKVRTLCIYS
jgi:hypothetical protein